MSAVPALFFASTRYLAAGMLMLASQAWVGPVAVARASWPRLFVVGVFTIGAGGLLFWGMRHTPSGLAAIVNLSLTPVGLTVIGLLYGEEKASPRQAGAIALGIVGLAVLFGPRAQVPAAAAEAFGLALAGAAALIYCWGSVLGRPLLRRYAPLQVGGLANLAGAAVLLPLALVVEPVGPEEVAAFLRPPVLAAWLFLVVFGSAVAFAMYLRLLRDWGPTRAGMYAFVSPVVATGLGIAVFGETLSATDVAGGVLMLVAAWLALRR